jgi:hypothetical protein
MNCEDVFVILTRGPFPSGARSDAAVEAHLQVCPDCQRLAAALRPNERGPHDADESHALPGYWGNSLEPAGDLAISLSNAIGSPRARRLGFSRQQQAHFGKNLSVWQFAAAVALGIVLAATLRTLVTVHTPNSVGGDPGIGAIMYATGQRQAQLEEAHWARRSCRRATAAIKLPSSLADDPSQNLMVQDLTNDSELCCTLCHQAGEHTTQLTSAGVLNMQKACIACHHDPEAR